MWLLKDVRFARPSARYGDSRRLINAAAAAIILTIVAIVQHGWAQSPAPARLVVLGDSLTAGFGLPATDAFPVRLEAALRKAGHAVEVVGAGVSGDTSAGGLARLDWVLNSAKANFAIVELGSNDGLRGLDPAQMFANLDQILTRLKARGVKPLLAGMLAPPNFGREYGQEFSAVFTRLAEKHGVLLYPFFLDGVAAQPQLNQADGIHPNLTGVEIIVERITPFVTRLITGQS
jgi:acyl-CoA thioesterase I